MMSAKPYRNIAHDVFVLDAKRLLEVHFDRVQISTINSGATIPWKHPRGSQTFQKLSEFDLVERLKHSNKKQAIAEFTLEGGLFDIVDFVTKQVTIKREEIAFL